MVDFIKAFEQVFGVPFVPPPTVLHPGTGCICTDCWERDTALENIAEQRAAERRGD